jgi:acetoin utilization deacetylase AcuC-like enzyme
MEHDTGPGHPESALRLPAITGRLREDGLFDRLVLIEPAPANEEWLTAIHTAGYIERVKAACEQGAAYIDTMDVPVCRASYRVAVAAVGGVLNAVDAVVDGRIRNAFCAVRPPGHHAMADHAMGFCLFNNVAIAARYIQKQHGFRRILIVDWDVHHGNGTQAAFYDDPEVMYFSVHRYPFYPGTGTASEKGIGDGRERTLNCPLAMRSCDKDFLDAFKFAFTPAALEFNPDFVLISAGFDAHRNDPLGGMGVTAEGYAGLTRMVKGVAEDHCDGRVVSLLEGGYDLDGLAESVSAHVSVLMA